jgi:hypothetical protein
LRLALVAACVLSLAACSALRPKPITVVQVDTVVVTREAPPPPLPDGDSVEICLSTGASVSIRVAANGDTLIGERRVTLSSVQPVLGFAGTYASGLNWFDRVDTLRFESRVYKKLGRPVRRACDELKRVGDHGGVPIFAEVTAPQVLPQIEVPVRPGMFQAYIGPAPRRRR